MEDICFYITTSKRDTLLEWTLEFFSIYWAMLYNQYQIITPLKSEEIAQLFSKLSGYIAESVPENSSFAGFKDWFILNYNLLQN